VTFEGEAVRKSTTDRFNLSLLYNYAEDDQWLSACGGFRFRYVIARSVTFSDNLKFCPNLEQWGGMHQP